MSIRIGCIGGGQLARMMGEEIKRKQLPYQLIVLDPTQFCPAAPYAHKQLLGHFKEADKIKELAKQCDVLTYEIELANVAALKEIEQTGMSIHPSPHTLSIIQDKYTQAQFLAEHTLAVPKTRAIDTPQDLEQIVSELGFPCMLKARRDGYDGRGNYLVKTPEDFATAKKYFKDAPVLAQEYIDFQCEVSVIAARNTKGQIVTYQLGENIHRESILEMTIVPARVSNEVKKNAELLACSTLNALQGGGVFGIEMFVDRNNQVLINEIAPRVHNSGHHTIEACATSQFEQHLRAITGQDLGSTQLTTTAAVMHNILGDYNTTGLYEITGLDIIAIRPGAGVHWYKKHEVKPKRKMGHFTLTASNGETVDDLIAEAKAYRAGIKFIPFN